MPAHDEKIAADAIAGTATQIISEQNQRRFGTSEAMMDAVECESPKQVKSIVDKLQQ